MKKTILIILGIVAVILLLLYGAFLRLSYSITENSKDNTKIDRDLNWSTFTGTAYRSPNQEDGLGIQYMESSEVEKRPAFQPLEHFIDADTSILNSANQPIQLSDIEAGDDLRVQINKKWCYGETLNGKNNRCIVKIHSIQDLTPQDGTSPMNP